MTARDDDTFGPGTRWLAERAGVTPEELVADPGLLARALGAVLRDAPALAAAREQVLARLSEGETAGERFGRRIAAALRAQAERTRGTTGESTSTGPPTGSS